MKNAISYQTTMNFGANDKEDEQLMESSDDDETIANANYEEDMQYLHT